MDGISKQSLQNNIFNILGFASLLIVAVGLYFITIANVILPFVGTLGWTFGFFLVSFGFGLFVYVINLYNQSKAQENNVIVNQKLDKISERLRIPKETTSPKPSIEQTNDLTENCGFYKRLVVILLFLGLVLVVISVWLSISIVNISLNSVNSEKMITNCNTPFLNNTNSTNGSYFIYNFSNVTTVNYQIFNNYSNQSANLTQDNQTVKIHNPPILILCFILILLFIVVATFSKRIANYFINKHWIKGDEINEAEFWINAGAMMLVIVCFSYIDLAGDIDTITFPNADHLPEWLMVIATFLVLYVTITYARSTKEQVTISKDQLQTQTRPWVHAYLARKKEEPFLPNMIWLVIENTGFSPAMEIQFKPEPDKETGSGLISSRYDVFNKGIDYLGPHQKISFLFADTAQDVEYQNSEFAFNLIINYKDQSGKVYANNRYPIEPYRYWGGRFLPMFED